MGAGSSQDVHPASMNYFDTVYTDLTRTYLFLNFVISTFRAVDVGSSQKRCFIYSFSSDMILSIQSVRLHAYTPCFTAFRVVVTEHVLST